MSNTETLVGGWTKYHDLTKEDRIVFEEAIKESEGKLGGVIYTPYAVSTQVVAGTNYRFECNASRPPSDIIWKAIVEIFKPLDGEPYITGIIRL